MKKVPERFVPITLSHSFRVISSILVDVRHPAQLTRMSIWPNLSKTSFAIRLHSTSSEMSPKTAMASPPSSMMDFLTISALSAFLPTIAIFAPAYASWVAMLFPMPCVAPVTIAQRFFNVKIDFI